MAKVSLEQTFDAMPNTAERTKSFKSALWGATDKQLAAVYVVGSKLGTLTRDGRNITEAEKKAISLKIKDKADFNRWQRLFVCLNNIQGKLLLVHENAHKVNNFMQAMAALWQGYENISKVFNHLLLDLTTNERTKGTPAAKMVQDVVLFERNEAVVSFGSEQLVFFNIGEDGLVTIDYSVVKKALENGKDAIIPALKEAVAFNDAIEFAEKMVSEEGETIPEVFTGKIKSYIEGLKKDLSFSRYFSSKVYNQLLAEGKTEEAEELAKGFIFPDYETTPRNERLYQVLTETISTAWK